MSIDTDRALAGLDAARRVGWAKFYSEQEVSKELSWRLWCMESAHVMTLVTFVREVSTRPEALFRTGRFLTHLLQPYVPEHALWWKFPEAEGEQIQRLVNGWCVVSLLTPGRGFVTPQMLANQEVARVEEALLRGDENVSVHDYLEAFDAYERAYGRR